MKTNDTTYLEPLLEDSSTKSTKRRGIAINKREAKVAQQDKCGRISLGFFIGIFFFVVYLTFLIKPEPHMIVSIPLDDEDLPGPKVPKGFLVWGPQCKIPDLNPLAKDVMKLFTKEEFKPCSKRASLTSIMYENNTITLVFKRSKIRNFMERDHNIIECCYREIKRAGNDKTADDQYNLTECINFSETTVLPDYVESILVKCKAGYKKPDKTVYTNAHAVIRETTEIRERLDEYKTRDTKRPLSILMMGIDSISRLNLIRAMPNTAQYLYDTGWFELRGYNKMDDNTYPNLMAILTGYNSSMAFNVCAPSTVGKLDTCPFLWNYFRDSGYLTAYAEDEIKINTFNYQKKGFKNQPTDYYMRPFLLAAEAHLSYSLKSSLKFCLGFQNYADYIYQYALDFGTVYKNDPHFGLFWTNTFSHNDISDPSSMDFRVKYYLEELERREILKNDMVIFFSDHGIRFGPVRTLHTGWLEERLPFMFIWLPKWFRDEHPDIVQALKINRNRLTTPYDIHATLKHILELSERTTDDLPSPVGCPLCQSVFKEVPWNRSCEDVNVEAHWCTCAPYISVSKNSPMIKAAVKYAIDYINESLTKYNNGTKKLCAHLSLKSISVAKVAEYNSAIEPYNDFLLIFDANPSNGKFETTVRYSINSKTFAITGSISRLNQYGSQSECMPADNLRKYCYCIKKKSYPKS